MVAVFYSKAMSTLLPVFSCTIYSFFFSYCEDMQRIGVIEDDARDRMRSRKMICCGDL